MSIRRRHARACKNFLLDICKTTIFDVSNFKRLDICFGLIKKSTEVISQAYILLYLTFFNGHIYLFRICASHDVRFELPLQVQSALKFENKMKL